MTDDHDLIEQLRGTMRAHTAHAEVPDRFAEHAWRTARRRTARRAAVAGAPLLAAAGVAIALLAGAGSGSGRGSPRTALIPHVTVGAGAGQARDTAFIVNRVKADVAADGRRGIVTRVTTYGAGRVSPHGVVTGTGGKTAVGYTYNAPSGAVYWRFTGYKDHAATHFDESDEWIPTAHRKYASTVLLINAAARTYSERTRLVDSPFGPGPGPNIESRPSEVRHALQAGRATLTGTTTIDGIRAITLSVTPPVQRGVPHRTLILFVDARTYQPLRTVDAYAHRFGLDIEDWLPTTADDVAKAENHTIPSGYARVARAY